MAQLNDFPVDRGGDTKILFGLRGCEIVASDEEPQAEATLRDVRPTHNSVGCAIGVWDRASGTIAAFPASTVPMASIVWNHFQNGGAGNILPTGFYGYIVGPHCTKSGGV